eukprot:8835470-Alexandrium_andersonii.AAC.1
MPLFDSSTPLAMSTPLRLSALSLCVCVLCVPVPVCLRCLWLSGPARRAALATTRDGHAVRTEVTRRLKAAA